MVVDQSLPATAWCASFNELVAVRGKPEMIVAENGSAFAGMVLDPWA